MIAVAKKRFSLTKIHVFCAIGSYMGKNQNGWHHDKVHAIPDRNTEGEMSDLNFGMIFFNFSIFCLGN